MYMIQYNDIYLYIKWSLNLILVLTSFVIKTEYTIHVHCFVWIILLINLNENFEMCRSGQFFPVLNATLFITIILSIVRYMSLEDPWLMNKHSLFCTQKSKLHMNLLFKVGSFLSHKTCSFINVCFFSTFILN